MHRIKSFLTIIFIHLFCISCIEKNKSNSNSEENWLSLFNGKDLSGWDIKFSGHAINDNYKNTFQVEDGMIRVVYDEYENFDDKYGHMYYETPFSYYKIRFDNQDDFIRFDIDYFDNNEKNILVTSINGEKLKIKNSLWVLNNFFSSSFLIFRVILLIHFQATKLFFKKVRFYKKPKQNINRIT